MNFKKLMVLISLMFLCGCALQSSRPTGTAAEPNNQQPANNRKANNNHVRESAAQAVNTLELLDYYDLYSNHDAEAQKIMLNELNQALVREQNNLLLRMKLSGILALPTSHYRDSAKAQQQLQSIIQNYPLGRSETALIGLLYEFTSDSNKQQQKLREEAKKNDILEKKLNDLKNIERTMIQRNTKPEGP